MPARIAGGIELSKWGPCIWNIFAIILSVALPTEAILGGRQLSSSYNTSLLQPNILITTGLQDGNTLGHTLNGDGLKNSTVYGGVIQFGGVKASSLGSWGQSFIYSNANSNGDSDIAEVSGVISGVTIGSVQFAQLSNIWMLDAVGQCAYKINTSSNAVTGIYRTQPAGTTLHYICRVGIAFTTSYQIR